MLAAVLAPLVASLWKDMMKPVVRWFDRKLSGRWRFLLRRWG
jgi:hypothetical protein